MPYRFEHNRSYMLNDKKHVIKENLIDGEKGLSFRLTTKAGEKFHRIDVKQAGDDKFLLKEKVNEKEKSSFSLLTGFPRF